MLSQTMKHAVVVLLNRPGRASFAISFQSPQENAGLNERSPGCAEPGPPVMSGSDVDRRTVLAKRYYCAVKARE